MQKTVDLNFKMLEHKVTLTKKGVAMCELLNPVALLLASALPVTAPPPEQQAMPSHQKPVLSQKCLMNPDLAAPSTLISNVAVSGC